MYDFTSALLMIAFGLFSFVINVSTELYKRDILAKIILYVSCMLVIGGTAIFITGLISS